MYAASGNDVFDFKVNFKVTRKVRKGFLGLQSTSDELVILNDGKFRQNCECLKQITDCTCQLCLQWKEESNPDRWPRCWALGKQEFWLKRTKLMFHHLSGCGKSTLLAALSQRLRGKLSSEILFNGEVIDRTKMTNISGFVPQNDVGFDGLTVREHLYFMVSRSMKRSDS